MHCKFFLKMVLPFVFLCATLAPAAAFTAADNVNVTAAFGQCSVERRLSSSGGGDGAVSIVRNAPLTYYDAGGSYFTFGNALASDSITASLIATCLSTTEGNVTGLAQNGANGTYAADNYMGFYFTLGTAAGALAAGTHHYYVGDINAAPGANTPAVITFTDPVSSVPVTSDVVTFSVSDVDTANILVTSYAFTTGVCNASLSFFGGPTVTINFDNTNGQYICARVNDGTVDTFLRSTSALNINNPPSITITDDVAVGPVLSDTFSFFATDANVGPAPTSSYAFTSGACDSSLNFTSGSGVTVTSDATNGQYICARASDPSTSTYRRSTNVLNINNPPVITIADDVSATPVTSDTFSFGATDADIGDSVTTGYALTSAACNASLSFTSGSSVTISDDTTNGQYICATANDGTAATYLRSTNALNINNLPVITITDDVSAIPGTSDTFAFTVADVDAGDTPVSSYALTSGACNASLSFTTGSSVTISDDTTNGQYICAMANDGTASVYLRSTNALYINSPPAITITDDVSASPVTTDTFSFSASDANIGDTVATGYSLTSAVCDASLSFTSGSSVTISDNTTNGQYICATANDGTATTYLRSTNALNINNAPTITITDDVSATPVTSDTFAFTASDVDSGDVVTNGYALTSGTCDASLTFTAGSSVTIDDDTTNGQYICATANDGTESSYLRSTNALNINNLPEITITDDVSATPVMSDTFAFTVADVDSGDMPVSSYALTSAACDASLTFTAGNSVTISDASTNGQYICATAYDGTADTYLRSTNALNIDLVQPTVTITGLPASISGPSPVDITVSFSEDVTGFDTADIDVTGASVVMIVGGPAAYTVTLLPEGNTDLVVSILADAATDEAGNLSLASEIVTIINTLPAETSAQIASFMQARARNLIANQPSLLDVIRGGGHFNADVTSSKGVFDFSSDMSHPIWFQLRGNWSSADTQTDQYVFGVLGTHYQPSENLWLGMMAQFDDARSVDGVAETAGWGWLIGPYIVAQHPSQPLYFEASALYGQSYNTVSPLGTFSDDFTTDRVLATARVTGEYDTGRMVLFPNIGLVYTSDRQHEYTDSLSNVIAAQSVSMTDFSAALDFELPLDVTGGQLMLTGGASVHYMAVGGDAVGISPYEGFSSSTELGLSYVGSRGARYSGSAHYDGIGNPGYEAYGVTFELSVPF